MITRTEQIFTCCLFHFLFFFLKMHFHHELFISYILPNTILKIGLAIFEFFKQYLKIKELY